MDKHAHGSDAQGQISETFSTSAPRTQSIILQRTFEHQSEAYALQCGLYVDRD